MGKLNKTRKFLAAPLSVQSERIGPKSSKWVCAPVGEHTKTLPPTEQAS